MGGLISQHEIAKREQGYKGLGERWTESTTARLPSLNLEKLEELMTKSDRERPSFPFQNSDRTLRTPTPTLSFGTLV